MRFLSNVIDPGYPAKVLYDLVFRLAQPDSTLEPEHLAVCAGIWRRADSRPWLAAALLRRCEPGPEEPDEATLRFVGRRLLEDLGVRQPVDMEQLLVPLPGLALMLPDEAWSRPVEAWDAFLRVAIEQLTLPGAKLPACEAAARLPDDTSRLASLFADAIGRTWSRELDESYQEPLKRYPWLAGLRDAARVEAGVRRLQQLRWRAGGAASDRETPTP